MDASPPNEPSRVTMDPEPANGRTDWSPGDALHRSRYLLAAAAAALLIASIAWDTPFAFTIPVIAILGAIAAFLSPPQPAGQAAGDGSVALPAFPDVSMQAVLEALPQQAFILDADGVVRYGNQRAAEHFPATRPGDPFIFTFRAPEIAEALRGLQAGGARSVEFHEPGERSNAYAVSFSLLRYLGRGSNLVLVTFDDVSERLAVARMRSDFVANASHELRTPLASLTGFIETLLGAAKHDPQASETFLKIMLDQARRMRRLIDDLLSLSRAEMRVYRRPTEKVDIAAVLREVRDALGPLAREHGVVLDLAGPDRSVELVGDRDELVQVFQNLIENAIRYGASGKRVEVSIEVRDGESRVVAVSIQDFGPGIAAEHLPRLTERFYRVDAGASREMKGTGLGLAIVKHILTRHRGALLIKSRTGEGAQFTVELPYP